MVAVSKEVHQLMQRFPRSCAFGISTHYVVSLSWRRRSFGVHPRFYPLLRPLAGLLERRFDISHVYTSLGDWHFLNALGRRPMVLTLTQHGSPASSALLSKVAMVAAETEPLADAARRAGVPDERIRVVYPGVDLKLFAASDPPPRPFRCLFASSPENESEIETKGVGLILGAAQRHPDVEFTLLWRPFGPAADAALEKVRAKATPNVRVEKRRVPDMHAFLRQFHFAVAPFRSVGKPCPNSILEMLAVGRPVLVSEFVDVGGLIQREGAGLQFATDVNSFSEAITRLCQEYDRLQPHARRCAQRNFDFDQTTRAYEDIYRLLLDHGKSQGRRPSREEPVESNQGSPPR